MKRIIALLMCVVLLSSVVLMFGMALTENGFTYELVNDEAVVTGYNNNSASIQIPATMGGKPVTKIGDFAFANRKENKKADISSLSMPDTVREIGDGAFCVNNTMKTLTLPAQLESIGARAFHCWMCLNTVEFRGKNLETIGNWAFRNCQMLSSVVLPESTKDIGDAAFSYCTALTSITLPKSVTSIGMDAFLGCTSMSEITVLNANLAIGDNACDLTAANSSGTRTLKIKGYGNSSAERFASSENFNFEELPNPDGNEPETPPSGDYSNNYYFKITYTVTGSNNFKSAYNGFGNENNDSAGISLLYKQKNGTESSYQEVKWDIKSSMGTTNTYTLTGSVDGFPYLLYGYLDDNFAFGSAAFNINKLEVGSSASNLKQVWSGKILLASKTNPYGVSTDWDNNVKRNYFGSTDSNNKVENSSGAWEKPYAKNILATFANNTLSLDKNSDSVTNAFTYNALDQYGVALNSTLCTVSTYSSQLQTNASNGNGTVTCPKRMHLTGSGNNTQSVTLNFNWSAPGGQRSGTESFELTDEKYTIRYYDDNGAMLTSQELYYGETPALTVPEKAATETEHFVNASWNPVPTTVANDADYTLSYSGEAHEWAVYEEECVAPTCESAGKTVYYCTKCFFMKEETVAALGHDFSVETVEATCQHGGYTTKTCKNCDYSVTTDVVPATDHRYIEEVIAPTCTHVGYSYFECEYCHEGYYGDTVVEKLSHDYQPTITEPTCTEGGYTTYTCSKCGDYYTADETAALEHDIELVVTAPTCTTGGYTTCTCKRCGISYQSAFTAPAHTFTQKIMNERTQRTTVSASHNATYYYTCAYCSVVSDQRYFEKISASFVGQVDMMNAYKPIVVNLLRSGEVVDSIQLQPHTNGDFCFFGLEPDIYNVSIRGNGSTVAEFDSVDLSQGAKIDLKEMEQEGMQVIEVSQGDVNDDGSVDMGDISVMLADGVYTNEEALGMNEDINNDGVIDASDLTIALFAKNFGKSSKVWKIK